MKWTLLGHACWLVESNEVNVLFDPLLTDPNQGGCYEIHPTRRLSLERMPRIDVVVITHRHLDHFDIASLAALPRHAEVLCPQDSLIIEACRALGFRDVVGLEEWQEVRYPGLSLTATRSENRVPELGFVVCGDGATVWNQVDTEVSSEVIARANTIYGKIDLLIAPWQPLLEMKYQINQSIAFPHRAYSDMLGFIREANVARVVPGACGFRYAGQGKWLNHVAFPVSRARFANDVVAACEPAELQVIEMDPGDVVHLEQGNTRSDKRSAGWVDSSVGEAERVWYCPVDPFGNLVNARQQPVAARSALDAWVKGFDAFLKSSVRSRAVGLVSLIQARAVFLLLVCDSDAYVAYQWDFGRDAAMTAGLNPAATVVTMVDEALLLKLDAGDANWEYVFHSGKYRSFETVADVSGSGYRRPKDGEVVDPLMLRYPYAQMLDRDVGRQVAHFVNGKSRVGEEAI